MLKVGRSPLRSLGAALGAALVAATLASPVRALAQNSVTLRFDLGEVAPVVYETTGEEAAVVPGISLDFEGYRFLSWNTEPDGSGRAVSEGDALTESATLYAQWAADSDAGPSFSGGSTDEPSELEGESDVSAAEDDPTPSPTEGSGISLMATANGDSAYTPLIPTVEEDPAPEDEQEEEPGQDAGADPADEADEAGPNEANEGTTDGTAADPSPEDDPSGPSDDGIEEEPEDGDREAGGTLSKTGPDPVGLLPLALGAALVAAASVGLRRGPGRGVTAAALVATTLVATLGAGATPALAQGDVGYRADGTPITGLVTVDGRTWCWSGGRLVRNETLVVNGRLLSFDDDGLMIDPVDDGEWHAIDGVDYYFRNGSKVHNEVVELPGGGWAYLGTDGLPSRGRLVRGDLVYFSDDDGVLLEPGWHELDDSWGSLEGELVYVEDASRSAVVGYSDEGGFAHWTRREGYVVRGAYQDRYHRTVLADDDGRLIGDGWVTLPADEGDGAVTYYVDPVTHQTPAVGPFEIDGDTYVVAEDGHVIVGRELSGGVLVVTDEAGRALTGDGWVVTDEFAGDLERYYVMEGTHGEPGARVGLFELEGEEYFGIMDEGYVARGSYWDESTMTLYETDNEGRVTGKAPARDLGGWDFRDWDYVAEMREVAEEVGSDTDWFVTIDCDMPCRDVVFHREGGTWVPVAGYYAVQGQMTYEGGSRTIPGTHKVTHKGYGLVGPGRCTCFVACFTASGEDDSQAIHAGYGTGMSGYGTLGCSGLTDEHATWIYENVPVGSTVQVIGNSTGIPSGADPRLPAQIETYPIDSAL